MPGRQYPLVPMPQGPDVGQTLTQLMQVTNALEDRRRARDEELYQKGERARAVETRSTLQSAMSSPLPPAEVKKQLTQLGRGDLIPVYDEAQSGLELTRLKLKEARDQAAAADKDYWGHLGHVVMKAKGDPLAIQYALTEAERDGHDVSTVRARLAETPDAWEGMATQLIANSPAQQARLERERAATLAETREERALRASESLVKDRVLDNARQDAAAKAREEAQRATEAHQRRMEQIASSREARAGQLSEADIARIEATYAEALNALDTRRRGRPDPVTQEMVGPLSDAEYQAQRGRLDAAYRRSLGTEAPPPPPSRRSPSPGRRRPGELPRPGGGSVSVRLPDGRVATFQRQEDADAFKRDAGIQ